VLSRFTAVVFLALGLMAHAQSAPPQAQSAQASEPRAAQTTSTRVAEPHNFRISGVVVDGASGAPLAQTLVAAGINRNGAERYTMTTAADGRFLFEDLPRGMYSLVAQRKGYAQQGFDQHENYWTGIAVGPDLDSENLVFRLRPAASISGRITDDQNEAVRDAQVMLFESTLINGKRSMHTRSQTQTNDEGAYRFGHLQPGKYLVAVSAQPWYAQYSFRPNQLQGAEGFGGGRRFLPPDPLLDVVYQTTFYPAATDAASASPIVLRPGDHVSADIMLAAVPSLHIRVNTGAGDPAHPAFPILRQRVFDGFVPSNRIQSYSPSPGVLELAGLAPGRYTMQVQTFDAKGQRSLTAPREFDASTNDVEVQGPDPSTAVPVTGTIRPDGNERPVRQFYIQLHNTESGENVGAQVQPDGDFDIGQRVPPGTYELQAASTSAFFMKSVTATGASVSGHRLTITGGDGVHLTIVMSHGVGTVAGTVMRQDKPSAGAMVVLIPADLANNPSFLRRDQSNSDGSFTLASVPPGKYTILAIQNGWDMEWGNPDVLRNYLSASETVTVAPDAKYTVTLKAQ
jgi:hypothetical protein